VPARLRPVLFVLAAIAIAAALIAPWAARADGDPASDTLLISTLYTPVSQKISPPVLAKLQGTIKAANAAGFKIRVALILDRTDLGAVPQLFGHPAQYVHLLSGELYYAWKGGIIAVQPSGIGVRNITPLAPAQKLADGIAVAKPATADTLAQAATVAIVKLAAQKGVTVSAQGTAAPATKSKGRSTLTTVLGGVLIVVLIALFIGQMVVRRRRRAPAAQE
jgi:hypothetical protein